LGGEGFRKEVLHLWKWIVPFTIDTVGNNLFHSDVASAFLDKKTFSLAEDRGDEFIFHDKATIHRSMFLVTNCFNFENFAFP